MNYVFSTIQQMGKQVGKNKVERFLIDGESLVCNADVMMEILKITQPRLSQLVKDKLVTKFDSGKYDLCTSVKQYIEFLRSRTIPNSMSMNIDYHEERARLTKMQADKAEMEVEELAGSLAKVDDVVKEWESILMDVKGKLLSIPSKLAAIIADETNTAVIQELLDSYIRETLLELSMYEGTSKRKKIAIPSDESAETTSETDNI
tara:strand:- start:10330 stop:10944 length:615 start_codon:yes stop_codon:yes gene_type:complete